MSKDHGFEAQTLGGTTVSVLKRCDNGNAPGGATNALRGLTRSSESTREGALMESTQNEPIRPIETRYAGCRFRSRLEARWAVCFDRYGWKWEYEPEGYALPSGHYLPDFLLTNIIKRGVWFEVKPESALGPDPDPKWGELTLTTNRPIIVAYGLPRHNTDVRHQIAVISAGKPAPFWIGPGSARFRAALDAARSARFEHGEVP